MRWMFKRAHAGERQQHTSSLLRGSKMVLTVVLSLASEMLAATLSAHAVHTQGRGGGQVITCWRRFVCEQQWLSSGGGTHWRRGVQRGSRPWPLRRSCP